MVEWATSEDVARITGTTVSDRSVLLANATIEAVAFAGLPMPTNVLAVSAPDADILMRAVAHQATMLEANPSFAAMSRARRVSSGDASADFGESGKTELDDHFLSPLSARLLASLSWKLEAFRAATTPRGFFPPPPPPPVY